MGRRASPLPSCSRRGARSWHAVLLAASILNSCFLLAQSYGVIWATKIPVTWEPLHPMEGQSLTLTPGGSLNFALCRWYRGGQVDKGKRIFMYLPSHKQWNGPAHTGRETGGSNCSLHIKRLMTKDTGNYTVSKIISDISSETGGADVAVLGPRRLDRGVVAGIVIGTICLALLVGFVLHCVLCGCCCCFRGGTQRGRYPMHPRLGCRRNTV